MSELARTLRNEFNDKEYAHAYIDSFLNESIATQIKVLREQRDWNQEQLASLASMKQSRISLLENVNYSMWSISTLKKLAKAFDLTLNVSFESFSTRIRDIENFKRKSLERLSRMDDLSRNEQATLADANFASTEQPNLNIDAIIASSPKSISLDSTKVRTSIKARDREGFYQLGATAQ